VADKGIKNVVILKQDLPSVNSQNQYSVRYRIVTDDRNRYSEWSPAFLVNGNAVTQVTAEASISGKVIFIVWNDSQLRAGYDIFVKFDNGQYAYHGKSTTTSYSLISTGTTSFRFLIQVESMSKEVNQSIKIYESQVIPLV
jgi:hypothetical protein